MAVMIPNTIVIKFDINIINTIINIIVIVAIITIDNIYEIFTIYLLIVLIASFDLNNPKIQLIIYKKHMTIKHIKKTAISMILISFARLILTTPNYIITRLTEEYDASNTTSTN